MEDGANSVMKNWAGKTQPAYWPLRPSARPPPECRTPS